MMFQALMAGSFVNDGEVRHGCLTVISILKMSFKKLHILE